MVDFTLRGLKIVGFNYFDSGVHCYICDKYYNMCITIQCTTTMYLDVVTVGTASTINLTTLT